MGKKEPNINRLAKAEMTNMQESNERLTGLKTVCVGGTRPTRWEYEGKYRCTFENEDGDQETVFKAKFGTGIETCEAYVKSISKKHKDLKVEKIGGARYK